MNDLGRGGKGAGQGRRGGRQGRGRMGGPYAAGPVDTCICPKCGHSEPHERGMACAQTRCPQCGTAMTRNSN
jgi:hypothetical protein